MIVLEPNISGCEPMCEDTVRRERGDPDGPPAVWESGIWGTAMMHLVCYSVTIFSGCGSQVSRHVYRDPSARGYSKILDAHPEFNPDGRHVADCVHLGTNLPLPSPGLGPLATVRRRGPGPRAAGSRMPQSLSLSRPRLRDATFYALKALTLGSIVAGRQARLKQG